ncbi:hypothetical protein BB558_006383 [Smittium angustum]|uniref:Uncharacterized protein n=1 Tax=Smittium angustum TaxID=133377 RepID=A0A2U1IXV6_SMIAN|nr:hypothetical protein BB558_006383 [Smittium angustum]
MQMWFYFDRQRDTGNEMYYFTKLVGKHDPLVDVLSLTFYQQSVEDNTLSVLAKGNYELGYNCPVCPKVLGEFRFNKKVGYLKNGELGQNPDKPEAVWVILNKNAKPDDKIKGKDTEVCQYDPALNKIINYINKL